MTDVAEFHDVSISPSFVPPFQQGQTFVRIRGKGDGDQLEWKKWIIVLQVSLTIRGG